MSNPFAKKIGGQLELELAAESTPEVDAIIAQTLIEEESRRQSVVGRVFGLIFNGNVAHLPAPPIESKRMSKRRMRRLRGKAKAA